MSEQQNPLSTPVPWNLVAEGYDQYAAPFFNAFSRRAIELVSPGPASEALDVACGPGSTTQQLAAAGHRVCAVDFSEKMLQRCRLRLQSQGLGDVQIQQMDGQALTFEDNRFDVAFSMFGLMFFPDRAKGFAELRRTLRPGGKVAVSSWCPLEASPGMKAMFSAFEAVRPEPPDGDPPSFDLEDPKNLEAELLAAGFGQVQVHQVTEQIPVDNIEELWNGLSQSSVPLVMLRKSLGEEVWQQREPLGLQRLRQELGPEPATIVTSAWVGVGTSP